jgi:hypothetical protein
MEISLKGKIMSILSRPERLTKEQYLEAIEDLKLGMT